MYVLATCKVLHAQRTNRTPVRPITIVITTTLRNEAGINNAERYPNVDPTVGPCFVDRAHLGCAPDVLCTRRVLVGYSVRTVVVPSLPTEVVVRVVEPMVVVVVETVALVVVVLTAMSRVTSEAVLSSLMVKEREVDDKEDSAEWMCGVDAKAVTIGDVGRSASDVGVTASVCETGKDAEVAVGDGSGTGEAGVGAGKGECER